MKTIDGETLSKICVEVSGPDGGVAGLVYGWKSAPA